MVGFYREAQDVLALLPGDIIVLADASGQQLINTRLSIGDPLPRRARQDELRRVFATGRPAISDLFIGALSRPLISLDVPVSRGNQVIFDLSLGFYPDRLSSILTEQNLPAGWVGAILDSRGVIAARTHDADRYVGQWGPTRMLQRMREVPEGRIELQSELAVFSRSAVSGYSVALAIPRAALIGDLRTRIAWLIGGALVLIVIGLAVARVISSKIANSIRGLIPLATALGRGEQVVVPMLPMAEADEVGQALQRASEMLRDREEILAAVSHDLRNPLTVMLLSASTAQLEAACLADGEPFQQFAAQVIDTANRMRAMVDDLLAVAVLTRRGPSMLATATIASSSFLSKAADAVRPLFESAGIGLEIEITGQLPELHADPDRILRVFVNLLDNALKFTERSGRVVLRARSQPDGVRFCVANSGPDIDADDLGDMFKPFWQAVDEDRRGAGLGLAICRAIVEAHGGRIWPQPEPGMRVCICFVLPTETQARNLVAQLS